MKTWNKDLPVPVAAQVYDSLIDRIANGFYPPGSRLDRVRTLRAEFNVSNTVMMQALDRLEKDQLIIRMPGKGIYVSSINKVENKPLQMMMVFPEPAISLDNLNRSAWYANTEVYRAIYEYGAQNNASIHLEYFPETEDPMLLNSQLQRLEGYDAAIFYGDQCKPLRKLAGEKFNGSLLITVIQWGRIAEPFPNELKIGYSDLELIERLVDFLKGRAYRNCSFIYHAYRAEDRAFFDWRYEEFQQRLIAAGIQKTPPTRLVVEPDVKDLKVVKKKMSEFLMHGDFDFVFFNGDDFSVCYEAVAMSHMILGVDIDIGFIGPNQLAPLCMHVQPPFYEIGEAIGRKLIGCLRNHEEIPVEPILLDSYLMVGDSVKKELAMV